MRPPEDRLFEKYRRRHDARLIAKVFDRTAPALLRIARHTAPRRDLVDDLLQQTFLVAIERADRWDPERGLFPWLVGILVRQAKLLQRREARQPAPERLQTRTESPPSADTAEARELEDAIAAAVADLGDTYRPVLHLHLFHGLNAKEIAAALDRPAGSVRTQLVRGLERLRRALPVGLALGAAAMAPILAAVRPVVLRHAGANAATLTVAGSGATLMLFGSSMMKKWSLAVLAIVLVTFVAYPLLPAIGDEQGLPVPAAPQVAEADLVPRDHQPAAVDSRRDRAPGAETATSQRDVIAQSDASLHVHVVAAEEPDAPGLEGVWVSLHTNQMRKPFARQFGAHTDANGDVRFDDVPAGQWRAQASIGAESVRDDVELVPGEAREIVLESNAARLVAVKVVDAAGRRVADAEVWSGLKAVGRIRPMQVNGRRAGLTDATGSARVAAGRGELVGARKRGYVASLSSPIQGSGTEAIVLVLRDRPATLFGEVASENGEPVVGATVQVVHATPKRQPARADRSEDGRATAGPLDVLVLTDANGQFEVSGLAPGTYRVWTDAATSTHKGATITVEPHDRKHVRLVVPTSAYVTGRVLRRDGTPAARLYIGVRIAAAEKMAASGVVNVDGTFTFKVPRGPVHLEVWRKWGVPLAEADLMAMTTPEPVSLTVDDPLSVSGRLLAEDGSPIRGWIVGAIAPGIEVNADAVSDSMGNGRMARSAEDGSFALRGCGDGPYTVFAQPVRTEVTGIAPVRRSDVRLGTTDLELSVPDSMLGRATLRLRVVDGVGSPIEGATAKMFVGMRAHNLELQGGTFSQDRLVHGSYSVEIHAPGHAGRVRRVAVDSADVDLGDIVLEPSALLRVRPLLDGKPWRGPLPRPVVHHLATGERVEPQPTGTASDGVLVLTGLPPGRFELRTSALDDLLGEPVPMRLLPGPAILIDWHLRIGRQLTLRFPAGTKVAATARLNVTIRDDGGDIVLARELAPNPGGTHFALPHVFAPGSYAVEAKQDGGKEWRWSFETVRWRNGATIDVPEGK